MTAPQRLDIFGAVSDPCGVLVLGLSRPAPKFSAAPNADGGEGERSAVAY